MSDSDRDARRIRILTAALLRCAAASGFPLDPDTSLNTVIDQSARIAECVEALALKAASQRLADRVDIPSGTPPRTLPPLLTPGGRDVLYAAALDLKHLRAAAERIAEALEQR